MFKAVKSTAEDIFLLDELLADFYNELSNYYEDLYYSYAEDLINDGSIYFILNEKEKVIGFYSLSPANSNILRYLYIVPRERNRKYGTETINKLLKIQSHIKLTCHKNNKKAIRFYNKFNNSNINKDNEIEFTLRKV
jgi:hypothetical protein